MFTEKEQRAINKAVRIMESKAVSGELFTSSASTKKYMALQIANCEHEKFMVLFLTTQHELIACEVVSEGTIDGAAVYPREIVKKALTHNAAAVMFAHNHPSGVAEPSQADISITRKLTNALATIDVRVLDHVVVSAKYQTSMADRGLL